ncbi:unnamed protein product [Leptidea sinapis]|uniref:Uncharacterized protein n=1 Tax=Leptidea sinapis TaxID=189913 RepID=A0A5E4QKR4_9NEOP|nr:unnamed protein product [Leptidea sinapis]
MTARGGGKKELDPEELMKRKFRAKCLFRYTTYNMVLSLLCIDLQKDDKALLNKKAEERTDQEKKYIFRIIGGLKCFKRYPNL